MTNVLGMDGGGRKTYAVLTDEDGAMLGAGESGASNWEIAGIEGAATALVTAASAALEAADTPPDGVA
ncbi:MAG: ATPase, partial [Actinomycetota bacterium]|nr:ATPase [Actinomycetota bacterium]